MKVSNKWVEELFEKQQFPLSDLWREGRNYRWGFVNRKIAAVMFIWVTTFTHIPVDNMQ